MLLRLILRFQPGHQLGLLADLFVGFVRKSEFLGHFGAYIAHVETARAKFYCQDCLQPLQRLGTDSSQSSRVLGSIALALKAASDDRG